MSIRATVLTSRVEAAPGALATAQVALHNDGGAPATVQLRVVGLDTTAAPDGGDAAVVQVPAGTAATCMVPVAVPTTLGVGEHAAAIEIRSDRPGDRPALEAFTVSIASVERVEINAVPSTVRGRRRARLRVDVANYEAVPVDLDLSAGGPDVQVRFRRPRLRVLPGQHALVTGRIRGPRHWVGERTHHNLVITGQGPASAATATAVFVQRPLFARRLRAGIAALTVIALWLGAVGGFAYWWTHRTDGEQAAVNIVSQTDTDGDGMIDLYVLSDGTRVTAIDTDGDGVPDAFVDAAGNPVPDPRTAGGAGAGGDGEIAGGADGAGSGGAGGPGGSGGGAGGPGGPGEDSPTAGAPTSAVVRGTVKAAGDPSDITITLTPIVLTAPAASGVQALAGGGPGRSLDPVPASGPSGDAAGEARISKYWPSRAGTLSANPLHARRATEAVRPLMTNPATDGLWLFDGVALRQSYELVFSKPGFDTQSFVVTPPADGSTTELDVELIPSEGSLAGHVGGPNGPLGGVAITVTDGTLAFTTTSATVGDVGSWSLEHVSTPGVYTITATRHGYGTEVRQVTLAPGEHFDRADVRMSPGVGSIAGHIVGPSGAPLGGATITAANGDVTYTTSSLTEGDLGYYLLPRLAIPGTYTVTVELDGYITQSRRVALGGAQGGVDFALVGTTLSLTGMITSAGNGRGIPNAGLTLTTQGPSGDLTFKASTAGGALAGSFRIDDLPPGSYTVRVEHYLHDTSTQLVTLRAGVAPPPLEVELRPNGGIDPPGTGSLVVVVVDNDAETVAEREIDDAHVRVVRTGTDEVVYDDAPGTFNVQIPGLAPGTYTVYVTAPGFTAAPARRVSIGLSEQRIEIDMVKLGQASGRLVDSVTGEVITAPYQVSLYLQPERPGDLPVASAVSLDGTWQTLPDSLLPGVYRIDITDNTSPAGYLVRPDQILDEDVVGETPASRFMRFVLPEGTREPVVVGDIEADRYPVLSGRIYRPVLDGSPTPGMALVPIDDPTLRVTIRCTDDGRTVNVTLADVGGVVSPDGDLYDSFTISHVAVDDDNLTGDCTFTVSARGYVTATAELKDVDANRGDRFNDRRLHIPLAPAPPEVGGSVFWRDGSTRLPLGGVAVSANPVTGLAPREADAEQSSPTVVRTPLSTTSAPDGTWDLDGQLFGVTPYMFRATGFDDGTIVVTVDGDGARATAGNNTRVTTTAAGRFDVELAAPEPRNLTGVITVASTTPPNNLNGFTVVASSPGTPGPVPMTSGCGAETSIALGTPAVGAGGLIVPYTVCNASPGTWTVTVNPPAGYVPAGGAASATVTQLVGPGTTPVPGFDVHLVELARVSITLQDSSGAPLDLKATDSFAFVGGVPGTATIAAEPGTNVITVGQLPVAEIDPVTAPVGYRFALAIAGRDVPGAVVTGPAGLTIDAVGRFDVDVVAGAQVTITLKVPEYGSITGSVEAVPAPWQVGTSVVDVSNGVTATRVRDDAGNPVTPQQYPVVASGGAFSVTGPPGYYEIDVFHEHYLSPGHPDFEDLGGELPATPTGAADPGPYRLTNETTNTLTPFKLPPRPAMLDLTVVRSLLGSPDCTVAAPPATCVDGAAFELVPANGTPGDTRNPRGTTVHGHATLALYPNTTYELIIRELDGTEQIAFPVIASISVGWFDEAAPNTVTVRAPLVRVAPSVAGTITALGSRGKAPLPTDTAVYDLFITYSVPEVSVTAPDGSTQATPVEVLDPSCDVTGTGPSREARCPANITPPGTTGEQAGVVGYEFPSVPVGEYKITWDTTPLTDLGYVYPPPGGAPDLTGVVVSPGTNNAPDLSVWVADVNVDITLVATGELLELSSLTLDGAAVTPASMLPDTGPPYTGVRLVLPPRLVDYTLTAASTLHDDLVPTQFSVPVEPGAPDYPLSLLMDPKWTRIEGNVGWCIDGQTPPCNPLNADGRVELLDSGGAVVAGSTLDGPRADYSFDVPAGTYSVRVSQDAGADEVGFTTNVVAVTPAGLPGMNGRRAPQPPVTIDKHAKVTVTVTKVGLLASPDVRLRSEAGTDHSPLQPVANPPGTEEISATFVVPPGTYELWLSATGYDAPIYTGTLVAGFNGNWPSASPARTIDIGVLGTANAEVTVKLFLATTTIVDDSVALATFTDDTNGTKSFNIVVPYSASVDSWFEQDLKLQVSAPGYRTQVVTAAKALQRVLADVTLVPTVTPTGPVNVPGVAKADVDGGMLTISSPKPDPGDGFDTVTGTVVNGVYSFPPTLELGSYPNGEPRTWTLSYERPGWGTDTEDIFVSAKDPVVMPALNVEARDVTVLFRVTDPAGAASASASVTFNGETRATNSSGNVSFTVKENFSGPWNYAASVDAAALYKAGTLHTPTPTAPVPPGFPPATFPGPFPNPSGHAIQLGSRRVPVSVTRQTGDSTQLSGVELTICAEGCATGTSLELQADAAGSYILAPVIPGNYTVTAKKAGHLDATAALQIGTDGLPSTGSSLAFVMPYAMTVSVTPAAGVVFSACRITYDDDDNESGCSPVSIAGFGPDAPFAAPTVAGDYRVTATLANFTSAVAEFTVAASGAPSPADLSFTLVSRAVSVHVKRADNNNPVTNATFTICGPAVGCTFVALAGVSGGTGGNYTFVAPIPAGTYTVQATTTSSGGRTGQATLTVASDGAVPTPAALEIAVTPTNP